MNTIRTEREIPIVGQYDVIVAGGGVSGFPAAIAAARAGAKTLVIDKHGWLGGYVDSGWGAGTVGYVFNDSEGNLILKGICWEILERLKAKGWAMGAGPRRFYKNEWPYKTENRVFRPQVLQEAAKTVAMEMVDEAGAQMLLHTWISDVIMENGQVKGLIVENKSGTQAILGKVIIDCTGDGDVAAKAGAEMDVLPPQERYQVSRGWMLANVDTEAMRKEILAETDEFSYLMEPLEVPEGMQHPIQGTKYPYEKLEVSEDGLHLKGEPGSHSFKAVGIFKGVEGTGAGLDDLDGVDAWSVSKAELTLRKMVTATWEKLRRENPAYKDSILMSGSLDLGVRETRRLAGEYVMTVEDVYEGAKFDDAVAQSMIASDCHHREEYWEEVAPKRPYEMPYRMMLPKNVEGVLVAGRCASMDHLAEAAIRKIPNCMAMGQAAGAAAALCAAENVTPRNVNIRALQKLLRESDVPLAEKD